MPKPTPKRTAARKPRKATRAAPVADAPAYGNGHRELLAQLWNAAVALRGSIEPADYKRYVLPIIFLRFLSLRFERRRAELEALVRDPASEYHTTNPKAAARILGDPDQYRSGGAFMVPEQARWDYILKNAQADTIKTILDDALELLETTYPDKLRGLLPRIYGGSNLSRESVTGLINLFAKDIFAQDHGGVDLIGRVYEYFIGGFADSEGKRGGEYFTPLSIVRTLVALLEPSEGVVFDPCCGSGGMFVQSDVFTHHNRKLSFVGQESKEFTLRLCRMNLFIHGIDGKIEPGNSYYDDQHAALRADYVLANPPFNDGSKGEQGWGANLIPDKDPRLYQLGADPLPLSARNANSMWILHFLYHLKEGGTAGFVMATGELSSSENSRLAVRKALIEADVVDCIVQLTGQLFANTQIPCSLWILSKNRAGSHGYRKRTGEILFIDGRKLGSLMSGSRKQKELLAREVEQVADVYRRFRRDRTPEEMPGFSKTALVDEVRAHNYALTPGRYVGASEGETDEDPFEQRFPRLVADLHAQFTKSSHLQAAIVSGLGKLRREE